MSSPPGRAAPGAMTGVARPSARGALLIAVGLSLGSAVALGLARFAYALLLPAMRENLHWSFVTAGAMNTANAAGYLAGALIAVSASRRLGPRGSFAASIALAAAALAATAATTSTGLLLLLRLIAGTAGGVTFVVGGGIAAHLGAAAGPRRAARLLGVYFTGGGLGILASALLIPALLDRTSLDTGWRLSWLLLGALALIALVIADAAARRTPLPVAFSERWRWPAARLLPLIGAYALFGCGYIAYMTFVVAFLRGEGWHGSGISAFWAVLGAAASAGGFFWAPLLGRLRGGRGAALLLGVTATGALLPLLSTTAPVAFLSALLFGISFISVVTAVTTTARRALHPDHWTAAVAGLTVAFALGQCLGPVLAGVLSDRPAGVRAGLTLSAAVLGVGSLVALAQRHVERPA